MHEHTNDLRHHLNRVPVLATKTPGDLRDELTGIVISDLLAPAGGSDEELNQYEDHAYQR